MRKAIVPILLLCLAPLTHANALDLTQPGGPVLLTVQGSIANTNDEGVAHFDLQMIDALLQHTTTAQTPWYDDVESFSGPLGQAILDEVGATGTMVTVTALNDYSAEIPIKDFAEHAVIFATRINGETLSIRDKGPLFVIYPFDTEPDLYNEVYFGRSVWQVSSITVH